MYEIEMYKVVGDEGPKRSGISIGLAGAPNHSRTNVNISGEDEPDNRVITLKRLIMTHIPVLIRIRRGRVSFRLRKAFNCCHGEE